MTNPVGRVRGKYQSQPGGKHDTPSVTTITGLLHKPGLPWAAARETAIFAVHHLEEWRDLSPVDAVDRLYKHHRGIWDDKASRGTAVHDLACRWAKGEECDVPAECDPFMDALEAFYRDHRPRWVEVEQTVIYDQKPHTYCGTFDAIAELDGSRLLLDIKTGGRYPIDTTLQLAAYRFGKHIGVYDPAGKLVDTRPMIPTAGAVVLYLHDDGTYELLEVPANGDAHGMFLRLRSVWGWLREMERWEKSNPERRHGAQLEAAS